MDITSIAPTAEKTATGIQYRHPAYGLMSVERNVIYGDSPTLFGSEITHKTTVTLTIRGAHHVNRLGGDGYHADEQLIQLELSEAQFAQMITMSQGVPVTLRQARDANGILTGIPAIERQPQPHRNQIAIEQLCNRLVNKMDSVLSSVDELVEAGRASKKSLAGIQSSLRDIVKQTPSDIAMVTRRFEEIVAENTEEAKFSADVFLTKPPQ